MQASSRKQQARRNSRRAATRNGRRQSLRTRARLGRKKRTRSAPANGLSPQALAEHRKRKAMFQAAVKNFGEATRQFNHQNYAKAKEYFEKALNGASNEVAERARMHLKLCKQKLAKPAPAPKGSAEYYNLGVAELNARNLDAAIEHLRKADKAAPKHDEIRYALAAVHALQGNIDAAFEHLKAAIDLRQANRFLARRDDDFEPLRDDPRYRPLLYPDNGSNGF
jgi:tetratricopeptide (TPR) repeat protein